MKSIVPVLLLLLVPLSATAQSTKRCELGLDIDVLWEGYWLPSTVVAIRGDRCLIQYEGYGDEDNEWVGLDRIRFIEKEYELDPGTAVEVLWDYDGEWYRATVIRSRGARYFISYVGWSSQWDEWVGRDHLRLRPRHSLRSTSAGGSLPARTAGTHAASPAAMPRASAGATNAHGSRAETSNNSDSKKRLDIAAAILPSTMPMPASTSPDRTTSPTTLPG